MAALPRLEQLLYERGREPFPPDIGAGPRFRRAFMHGRAFTSQEVAEEFKISGTTLPNTVKALREYGYVIESTQEGDAWPRQVRHRVVNVDHVPAPMYGPGEPAKPKSPQPSADTEKIRAALDAGVTVDRIWCDTHGVKFHNMKNVLKGREGDKYERVRPGVYRRRIGKPKVSATSAAARIREHLEAGGVVDREWIKAEGITPSTLHSFVNTARNRGVDIERLPDGGGYRLASGTATPNGRGRPPANANDRLPQLNGMAERPTLPPYPLLAEELQVRGISLTDDGTIQVALRNGTHLWVAEVVAQHKLVEADNA